MSDSLLSPSDALWSRVCQTTRQALASGALQPIETQRFEVIDGQIAFTVRLIDSLARKEKAQHSGASPSKVDNPFLPYEQDLFVANLSATHVCLLNKFNVVDHHFLIVTREYASQQEWLTPADFAALARCLQEINGLGFFNGGTAAGASQHHKHLQLIPLSDTIPMADVIHHPPFLAQCEASCQLPLPFRHGVSPLRGLWTNQADAAVGQTLHERYRALMTSLGIDPAAAQPNAPYNLLITREWMMAVRRSHPSYQGINVNSLGYAGWLLVKSTEQLEQLRQIGPLTLLTQVGLPVKPLDQL
ncbi:MAG: phosphorylase [Leptolyngbyaceae cyanobacterium]